ncbi:MAG: tripartite tricarboxylate transporter permease [Spirochaetia bacterium]|jgi:putative tricarboxylic transport membrane protein|nr:tripartite tricarboxylate transporter permease [Spirochaetia bacterium]
MDILLSSLHSVLNLGVLFYTLIGIFLGMFIGALPGLSATMGVAILLPLTFWIDPRYGLGMLFGIYCAAIYAGGVSAILLGVPGTPASIASTFDGTKIAKGGRPSLALWINTVYSALGGIFGVILLCIASFPIARFALKFGPPEYAMTALFGLSMMVAVSGKSIPKGLMVGFIGLGLAMFGMDPISGVKRYTFGNYYLLDGFSFVPIMIGLFGIGECLNQISQTPVLKVGKKYRGEEIGREAFSDFMAEAKDAKKRMTLKEMWKTKWAFLFSSLVSVFVGAIPGTGGDIASIITWTQCKNFSEDKDRYGEGSEEALAVTCASNNACIGGAMTTMLTLGIPGDSVTAILIGALMMYNYTPGPLLFSEHIDMVWVIFILLFICNLFILVFGNVGSKLFVKFTKLPRSWISTTIIIFSLVGSYAIQNSVFDVIVCLCAGLFGFAMAKADFPSGPIVLALILGEMIESNFIRSMMLPQGTYLTFFIRPISLTLIILIILSLASPAILKVAKREKERKQ